MKHFSQLFVRSALCALLLAVVALSAQAQTSAGTDTREPSLRYTVVKQDRLINFAKELLADPADWREVAKFNRMANPDRLTVGQQIDVPLRLLKFRAQQVEVLSASGDVSVAKGAVLAEGAQVRVGANSSVVLGLSDGSQIKVLPNSLAEVSKNRMYSQRDASRAISETWYSGVMRLAQGQVEVLASKAQRAETLKVVLPTAVVGVRGTVFRAGVVGSNNAKTEVVEGLVYADNPAQGSGATLGAGFGAVIDPTQREVKAVALLPAPVLAAESSARLPDSELQWGAVAGAASYRVQVARDAGFNELVLDERSTSPRVRLAALAQGNWHARARGIDAAGLEGLDASTRLAMLAPLPPPAPAPAPLAANPYQSLAVSSAALTFASGETVLALRGLTPAMQSHTLVFAANRDLAAGAKRMPAAARVSLGKLAVGEYFLRFVCNAPCATQVQSPLYRLELDASWGDSVVQQLGPLTKVGE